MANYDHPSYITRQMEAFGSTSAGNGTVSLRAGFPTGMRVRRASATVVTAGTSTGALINLLAITGTATATIQQLVLSTNTANTVIQGTDANYALAQGSVLAIQNGTDATAVCAPVVEFHLDPVTGLFSNP